MPGVSITVNQGELLISLGDLRRRVDDRTTALQIVGNLMYASVMKTFRQEGSPAGSWPELAESTKKKKGYTAGHKLLVLNARLRDSITFWVEGDTVTIGTNVVYAAVHQYGSSDRQGSQAGGGPKLNRDHVKVSAYDSLRVRAFRQYGRDSRIGKDGKTRSVRVRAQGPDNATRFQVGEHQHHQNIPARPFLVIRPEDPGRFLSGINAYLRTGKLSWEGQA